jgi:hypothetical protein
MCNMQTTEKLQSRSHSLAEDHKSVCIVNNKEGFNLLQEQVAIPCAQNENCNNT